MNENTIIGCNDNRNNEKSAYAIEKVMLSTNGRNEIRFDIEWKGDRELDYFELRVWESDKQNCLELCAYPSHNQTIVVKDFHFMKDWKSKEVNPEIFYVELGVADYAEDGELKSWELLAAYKPIEVGIYYEYHIFGKNVLEIR